MLWVGCGSVARASDWKVQHDADAGSTPWCGKGFFPMSSVSADSYGVCAAPVCNHMHHDLMHMSKIPSPGSHTIVWTHKEAAHTLVGMVGCCSCGCYSLIQVRYPDFLQVRNEVLQGKEILVSLFKASSNCSAALLHTCILQVFRTVSKYL